MLLTIRPTGNCRFKHGFYHVTRHMLLHISTFPPFSSKRVILCGIMQAFHRSCIKPLNVSSIMQGCEAFDI